MANNHAIKRTLDIKLLVVQSSKNYRQFRQTTCLKQVVGPFKILAYQYAPIGRMSPLVKVIAVF